MTEKFVCTKPKVNTKDKMRQQNIRVERGNKGFGLSLIYKVTLISEPQKIQHTDKTTMSTTTNYKWNVNAYRFSVPQI